jgi:hypothetical protein
VRLLIATVLAWVVLMATAIAFPGPLERALDAKVPLPHPGPVCIVNRFFIGCVAP